MGTVLGWLTVVSLASTLVLFIPCFFFQKNTWSLLQKNIHTLGCACLVLFIIFCGGFTVNNSVQADREKAEQRAIQAKTFIKENKGKVKILYLYSHKDVLIEGFVTKERMKLHACYYAPKIPMVGDIWIVDKDQNGFLFLKQRSYTS